jgi:hypothetical protein
MDHYDFFFDYDPNDNDLVRISAPLFLSPSNFAPDKLQTHIILGTQRDDYVTQMTKQGAPALVSFEQGDGRVILGTLTHPFSNAGLKEAENPEQVLNILALAKNKGPVWFDEWHHGVQGKSQILGPGEFLRHTPTGRAMLFASFAVLIVLFMQGRAFGKPVPLAHEVKRRGAMEHVTGIANLSRRASHRSSVMMNYHQQIKRKLGHRYRLDPGMDDELYVDKLSEYNPSIDKNELLKLLKRLKRKDLSEAEMVNLAVEASKWIDT